ncbi:hemolysin XhlA family protein [Bacillus bingmayongensis]|uniref:Hemolysin XhlA family protein n=1 Tax=Bacillus bingmayongensis TaxID=1150157 RepID=A0ABU5K4S2_9BACI|nr:hemolysin XhlA family protein [Bacillus bingmayongensis]MBY0599493.1 hemolysin XhlA family protein [Bacillus bingmayongensis]MDZ5610733.1 hemolysin XhlA family protein [Bacillus pseudomycoides]
MEELKELKQLNQKIDSLKSEQKEIMRDIRNLETRTTINEKDIATINKQLEKISMNTTWILRIIIGAVVMGILGLVMKGTL